MRNNLLRSHKVCLVLILFLVSCSSGGGGDSDSGPSGRTSKTGVRIVNASIDSVPLGLFQNELFLSKSSYLEQAEYTPVTVSPSLLNVTRGARVNEKIRQLNFQPENNMEYTILVLGEGDDSALDIELLSESILRPEKGFGRVRFVNALIGANSASCSVSDGLTKNNIKSAYGVLSEPVEMPFGIKTVRVESSGGGVQTATFNLEDRGELLIILAGKTELGFSILKAITDLD